MSSLNQRRVATLFSFLAAAFAREAIGAPVATPIPAPVAALLNDSVGYLAADPARPRVYATVPNDNSVIVIDTASLTVIKTIPIGSSPQGLALSADGSKLWVANSGSTTSGIGIVDLETLTTLPSYSTPALPFDIKEGAGHRLYVTPKNQNFGPNGGGMMQIDGDTGTFQTYLGGFEVYASAVVDVSPDRNTLFFGSRGSSPSTLARYDISTATPALLQKVGNVGSNGIAIRVSHNGQFLVYPNGSGNGSYETYEIPTSNLSAINGSFNVGAYPISGAFSNDDSLLYHGTSSQSAVKIFDTKTFNQVGTLPPGSAPGTSGGYDSKELVVDRSGRWLFVATSFFTGSGNGGDLRVFDVGPPELGNISTRLNVGRDENVLIGGLIITGNQPKKVAMRAMGPSLSQVGISGAMTDPTLELHDSNNAIIATNDDWQITQIGGVITSSQVSEIQSRGLAPSQTPESVIIAVLQPGNYTAVLKGKNNATGIAVVETYDLDRTADSKLGNIATRGFVQTGDVMIGGTIVTGNSSANVLVRAIGPSLTGAGISNPIADPTLELRNAAGTLEASNDDWRSAQETAIQDTGLAPTNNAESAILAAVVPGPHTAIVRGKSNGTGVAVVEIYQLAN